MLKKRGRNGIIHEIEETIIIHKFKLRDLLQVLVGASILSVPVGFTEETWGMGEQLPMINILGLLVLSLAFISMFTYYQYHHGKLSSKEHASEFVKRVIFTYLASFVIVTLILVLIQRAPWTTDLLLALKRTIIVAFPASLSAAIADTFE